MPQHPIIQRQITVKEADTEDNNKETIQNAKEAAFLRARLAYRQHMPNTDEHKAILHQIEQLRR